MPAVIIAPARLTVADSEKSGGLGKWGFPGAQEVREREQLQKNNAQGTMTRQKYAK